MRQEQVQKAYAETISILFSGSIQAKPADITAHVIQKVDTMITEIAQCSKAITELSFALIFQAAVGYPVATITDILTNNILIRLWLMHDPKGTALSPIHTVLQDWIHALTSNYRHIACVTTARAKWRSAIQMELMGV